MIDFIGIVTLVLAVTGVVFNIRRLRVCFVFWMPSNFLSTLIHIGAGIWPLAVRDFIFLILAVEGWFLWKEGGESDAANRKYENVKTNYNNKCERIELLEECLTKLKKLSGVFQDDDAMWLIEQALKGGE